VGAANARGAESTLELRVNDVRWQERDTLHGAGPDDRIFVARRSDEGDVTVMFGDGVSGARPPSGQDNISARYRIGLGLAGRVKAGQLSLLLSRPPGLREARNALDAAGAADPEERDEARANAPLTVLTLDRVVSLRDYEDYARAFAGVGKAQATWLWDGETRFVHVTVAGAGGAPLPDGSDVHTDLAQSLDAAREPTRRVVVATYRRVNVFINAGVAVHPDHTKSVVHAAVTAALTDAFAFARRSFGQPVTKSEVLAVMQRVEGVVAADLNLLYAAPQSPSLNTVLVARGAYWDTTVRPPVARAAVLLLLATNGVTLTDMAP
jgi:predicted phage baseplate assembly protein